MPVQSVESPETLHWTIEESVTEATIRRLNVVRCTAFGVDGIAV
jgi:hypothetical protein